jgi:formamidopyrimidine-DNA glycosylase
MPELPELTVIREVLQRRILAALVTGVDIIPPGGAIVVRDLTLAGFESSITGKTIHTIERRGKFLIFTLMSEPEPLYLVLNPKLTGRLRLSHPVDKKHKKTHVIFHLSTGDQLRYIDQKQMGQIYLTFDLDRVPGYTGMGPEALDISSVDFSHSIMKFRGEIKGIFTRGDLVAGIGNAYADEILWEARLHPYRKRTDLTGEEIDRLYLAMRKTLIASIEHVREAMGENIDQEPRQFMAVHMKTDMPCPRCGSPVSLVSANQRITNFCRTCQPGGLIKGMD